MLRRGRLRGARSFLATSRGDPRPSDLPIFRSRVSRKRAGRARGCPRCAAADARPREGSPRPPEAPSTRCSERGPLRPRGAIPDSARSPNARPKRVFFALVEADWPGRGPLGDAPQAAASGVVRQRGAPRGPRSDFEAGSRTHAPLPRPCPAPGRAHAPHHAAPMPRTRPRPGPCSVQGQLHLPGHAVTGPALPEFLVADLLGGFVSRGICDPLRRSLAGHRCDISRPFRSRAPPLHPRLCAGSGAPRIDRLGVSKRRRPSVSTIRVAGIGDVRESRWLGSPFEAGPGAGIIQECNSCNSTAP